VLPTTTRAAAFERLEARAVVVTDRDRRLRVRVQRDAGVVAVEIRA
jgi:hypothetical protein